MPSAIIEERRQGAAVERLSHAEKVFVMELLADDMWNPVNAARKAGYKNAPGSARALMQKPAIAMALGKEQRRRLERVGMRADEVIEMLRTALFFNPLSLFHPTKDGKWAVEDLDKIPDEIGRCISKIKVKTVDTMTEDGSVNSTTYFELELMDKATLLNLAMKHCGVDGTSKVAISSQVDVSVSLSSLLTDLERSRNVIDQSMILKRLEEAVPVENLSESGT
jgi:hypothetical protein